jgi:hypothetical protein
MPVAATDLLTKSFDLSILAMHMKLEDTHHDSANRVVRQGGRRHVWRVCGGLLIGAILALSGCVSDIGITTSSGARPVAVATVEPAEHQLRIVAVDFDPPLSYAQISPDDGVTLMVAVENQGRRDEANVQVSVRLVDPSGYSGTSHVLDETLVLTELSAGQISVVRFSRASGFPLLDRYRLEVAVGPVADELETDDNFRTYEIVIPGGE